MKILTIGTIECQLINNQVYLYSQDSDSEVLNIQGIEENENAEEIIISEIEALNSSSFSETMELF